jgi:hypothetical protein
MLKLRSRIDDNIPSISSILEGIMNQKILILIFIIFANLGLISPTKAELSLTKILENTPQTPLIFSSYTVGSVISGAGDRVYILNVQKEQFFTIEIHSLGARAFVTVFNDQGQELVNLNGFDDHNKFNYEIPQAGNYYIFCYSGPTFHFYDFTVRVD